MFHLSNKSRRSRVAPFARRWQAGAVRRGGRQRLSMYSFSINAAIEAPCGPLAPADRTVHSHEIRSFGPLAPAYRPARSRALHLSGPFIPAQRVMTGLFIPVPLPGFHFGYQPHPTSSDFCACHCCGRRLPNPARPCNAGALGSCWSPG